MIKHFSPPAHPPFPYLCLGFWWEREREKHANSLSRGWKRQESTISPTRAEPSQAEPPSSDLSALLSLLSLLPFRGAASLCISRHFLSPSWGCGRVGRGGKKKMVVWWGEGFKRVNDCPLGDEAEREWWGCWGGGCRRRRRREQSRTPYRLSLQ